MADSDQFIDDFLAHRKDYDPDKAHEYYMRTRKLHPKQSQNSDASDERKTSSANAADRAKALHQKLDRVEKAAQRLPENKRNAFNEKIKGLRTALGRINDNPFKGAKVSYKSPFAGAKLSYNAGGKKDSKGNGEHPNAAKVRDMHSKLDQLDEKANKLPPKHKEKAKSRIDKIRGKIHDKFKDPHTQSTSDTGYTVGNDKLYENKTARRGRPDTYNYSWHPGQPAKRRTG